MKADPQAQGIDLELPQVDHRLRSCAKESATSELKAHCRDAPAVVAAEESLVGARDAIRIWNARSRARAGCQTVRSRVPATSRPSTRCGDAQAMTDIQHELQSLARRQAEQRRGTRDHGEPRGSQSTLRDAELAMDQARRDAEETAAAAWDRREDEIASETVALEQHRADVVAMLPADLVALYEGSCRRSEQASAARSMRLMPVGSSAHRTWTGCVLRPPMRSSG